MCALVEAYTPPSFDSFVRSERLRRVSHSGFETKSLSNRLSFLVDMASPQSVLGALSPSADPAAELAAARAQNAQMQAAGTALQQKVAALEAEKAAMLLVQSTRSGASGSSGSGYVSQPKGPTPPEFHGTKTGGYEIDSWVRDMRNQFDFYGVRVFPDDTAKVRHAAMFLKGRAAEWWDAEDKTTGVTSDWDKFVERLRERYRPMQAAVVARERLRRLKQTGAVSAYADLFQKELTPIKDMSASDQIFNFVTGLASVAVANKVREKEPKSLHEAMDIAVRAEVFLSAGRFGSSHTGQFVGRSSASSQSAASTAPMDLNVLGQANSSDFYDAEASDEEPSRQAADADLSPALLAKMEAMVQHRVAALLQSKEFPSRGFGDRVPGLKASDIDKLRAEGRCFRCKQKGHSKRDCPKGNGVGKPSFQ